MFNKSKILFMAVLLMIHSMALLCAAERFDVHKWEVDKATAGILVEDHRTPLVQLRIEFPAGNWSPWALENHVEEAWTLQMEDVKGAFRTRADKFATEFGFSINQETSVLAVKCRKNDLKDVLILVHDILTNRDWDRKEISRRNNDLRMTYEMNRRDPGFVLRQAMHRLVFAADDPRRQYFEKPKKMIADIPKLADIRDLIVRLPGRVIGFAGDLTPAESESLVRDWLPPVSSQKPSGSAPQTLPLSSKERRPAEMTLPLRRLTQVYFAYGRNSLALKDSDRSALLISDHVLGGHYYSRLYEALRHASGDTYTVGIGESGVEYGPGGYLIGTYTKADNAAAEQKFRLAVKEFCERGITGKERMEALSYILGRSSFDRQAPGQLLDELLWERRLGLPRGFKGQLVERAAAMSLTELNDFIHRFYDPAQFTMIKVVPGK